MLRAFFKFSSRVDGSEQCSVGARPETSQESQILATQVVHLDADTFLPLTKGGTSKVCPSSGFAFDVHGRRSGRSIALASCLELKP